MHGHSRDGKVSFRAQQCHLTKSPTLNFAKQLIEPEKEAIPLRVKDPMIRGVCSADVFIPQWRIITFIKEVGTWRSPIARNYHAYRALSLDDSLIKMSRSRQGVLGMMFKKGHLGRQGVRLAHGSASKCKSAHLQAKFRKSTGLAALVEAS